MFEYEDSFVNSLVPNAQYAIRSGKKANKPRVHCTTIDKFCGRHSVKKIDVLKIDTEGFDLVVLTGACDWDASAELNPVLFMYMEFNDLRPKEGSFGGALMPVDDLLRPLGYRFIVAYNDYVMTSRYRRDEPIDSRECVSFVS